MCGIDGDDDFRLLLELQEDLHLAVGLEAGQYARSVVIVKQLAAKFQIQLAAEGIHALEDPLRLQTQIFIKIKSDFCHSVVLFLFFCNCIE